jgi:hypothetical protein
VPVAPATSLPASASAGGPQILSLRATPKVVHNGQSVVWDVRTTPDVVSVDAKSSFYALQLQKHGPGRFGLTFTIPSAVPWFFHGTYPMEVSAYASNGARAQRSITLTFQ